MNDSQAPVAKTDGKPEASPRLCRHCRQEIADQATVCHQCTRSQNSVIGKLQVAGFAVPIVLMIVSVFQLMMAQGERVAAADALAQANAALAAVTAVQETQTRLLQATNDLAKSTDQLALEAEIREKVGEIARLDLMLRGSAVSTPLTVAQLQAVLNRLGEELAPLNERLDEMRGR